MRVDYNEIKAQPVGQAKRQKKEKKTQKGFADSSLPVGVLENLFNALRSSRQLNFYCAWLGRISN